MSFMVIVGKSGCHSCSLYGSLGVILVHYKEIWVLFLIIVGNCGCHSWLMYGSLDVIPDHCSEVWV